MTKERFNMNNINMESHPPQCNIPNCGGDVGVLKSAIWDMSGRICLLENFIKEQFGDIFWSFCERAAVGLYVSSTTNSGQPGSSSTKPPPPPREYTSENYQDYSQYNNNGSSSSCASNHLLQRRPPPLENRHGQVVHHPMPIIRSVVSKSPALNLLLRGEPQIVNAKNNHKRSSLPNQYESPAPVTARIININNRNKSGSVSVEKSTSSSLSQSSSGVSGSLTRNITIASSHQDQSEPEVVILDDSPPNSPVPSTSVPTPAVVATSSTRITPNRNRMNILRTSLVAPSSRSDYVDETETITSIPGDPTSHYIREYISDDEEEVTEVNPCSIEIQVDPSTMEFSEESIEETQEYTRNSTWESEYVESEDSVRYMDDSQSPAAYDTESGNSGGGSGGGGKMTKMHSTYMAMQNAVVIRNNPNRKPRDTMQPTPCHIKCQNKCAEWSEDDRQIVFSKYTNLPNFSQKEAWIISHLERAEIAKKKTLYSNFRTCTFKYYLPHPVHGLRQVCKAFFCATVGEPRNIVEKVAQALKNCYDSPVKEPIPFARKVAEKRRRANNVEYSSENST